jgi:hypothetical protein
MPSAAEGREVDPFRSVRTSRTFEITTHSPTDWTLTLMQPRQPLTPTFNRHYDKVRPDRPDG